MKTVDELAALDEGPGDDVLVLSLRLLVHRDLTDATLHMMEEPGWMPITVEYAKRLRELDQQHRLWDEEPDLIRVVLDGSPPGVRAT